MSYGIGLISKDWKQIEHILNLAGVSIQYKVKGQSDTVQGISFKKGEYSFKGLEIDRKFNYSKLNQQLQQTLPTQNRSLDSSKIIESNSVAESIVENVGGLLDLEQHGTDYQKETFRERMEYEEKERQRKAKRRREMRF